MYEYMHHACLKYQMTFHYIPASVCHIQKDDYIIARHMHGRVKNVNNCEKVSTEYYIEWTSFYIIFFLYKSFS